MSGWMPSTSQVRADFGELAEGTSERRLAGFDRWLASVERAAAEKALWAAAEELETAPGRGVTIVSEIRAHHATWLREFAEAYRREETE